MARLELGVLVSLVDDMEAQFGKVVDLGLHSCQVCSWDPNMWTDRACERLAAASARSGVRITTFWAGWPGPAVWNFVEGPTTIGLVPPEHRAARVEVLKQAADFAGKTGLSSITTHVGFLPEDPNDDRFGGTVEAIREIAEGCAARNIEFRFETGQETPVTLLRTIERVGTGNLGVNLDTANLILYGRGHPIDALDVFGAYVRDVHAKDGLFPTNGTELGTEVPLGEGKVDFPRFVEKLKSIGYDGPLTIEREITGEQQVIDIKRAIALLRSLCG